MRGQCPSENETLTGEVDQEDSRGSPPTGAL